MALTEESMNEFALYAYTKMSLAEKGITFHRDWAQHHISLDSWSQLCFNVGLTAAVGLLGLGIGAVVTRICTGLVHTSYMTAAGAATNAAAVASAEQFGATMGVVVSTVVVNGAWNLALNDDWKSALYGFLADCATLSAGKYGKHIEKLVELGYGALGMALTGLMAEVARREGNLNAMAVFALKQNPIEFSKLVKDGKARAKQDLLQAAYATAQGVKTWAEQEIPLRQSHAAKNAPKYEVGFFSRMWGNQVHVDHHMKAYAYYGAAKHLWGNLKDYFSEHTRLTLAELKNIDEISPDAIRKELEKMK